MKEYKRIVKAALSEDKGPFGLAEALAEDIPKAQGQTGVRDELIAARTRIIEVGGVSRSVRTLEEYRDTARHFTAIGRKAEWVEGFSFTAHRDAYKNGISADEFRANPQTATQIREDHGKQTNGFIPTAKDIEKMSPEQKKQLGKAVAEDTATMAAATDAYESTHRQPSGGTSAGSGGGLAGDVDVIELLSELGLAVTTVDNRMPEFTSLLREGKVPNGDAVAAEWNQKLTIAAEMLALATM